jgi:hypothetical protein
MFRRSFVAASRAARRIVPSLGLAAAVLTSTLGAPIAALADETPIVRDHRVAARIQVIVKNVLIIDDRDDGAGELALGFSFNCIAKPNPCPKQEEGKPKTYLDGEVWRFSANSGQTQVLDRTFPWTNPANNEYRASPEMGYPVYPDQVYELSFAMTENDWYGWGDDDLGSRAIVLTPENQWGTRDGTYKLRSTTAKGWGDFEIEFEVRKAPLPDLEPIALKVSDLPNSTKKHVCVNVTNSGPVLAGPFVVSVAVDGTVPADGKVTAGGLVAGQTAERCADMQLPTTPGEHKLVGYVDDGGTVLESFERNNSIEFGYVPQVQQTTTPAQQEQKETPVGAAQADLTVASIKVNGQVPDGKNDCKDGKTDVSVTVKNAGTADAEGFVLALAVDGGDAIEQSVSGLEAGKEREVTFEDVKLKKGERKLAATADAKNALAESKDDNNGRTVTAVCNAAS